VAHRTGNVASGIPAALADADIVELDVHRFRKRLEVRHSKVLWPLAMRWDRWKLVPKAAPRPTLAEILREIDPATHLWLDLKGFGRRLTTSTIAAVVDRPRTTVSSRSWWILPDLGRHRNIRVVHSVGSRLQLWALRAKPPRSLEAIAVDQRLVNVASMAAMRRVTSTVFVWGVHDVDRAMALVATGADGLIVDGSETIARIRKRLQFEAAVESKEAGRTIRATVHPS
jgi:glycerophosphoryl diester phosphodiesterase